MGIFIYSIIHLFIHLNIFLPSNVVFYLSISLSRDQDHLRVAKDSIRSSISSVDSYRTAVYCFQMMALIRRTLQEVKSVLKLKAAARLHLVLVRGWTSLTRLNCEFPLSSSIMACWTKSFHFW